MTDMSGLWERLSEELVTSDPAISRSAMMGLPCLRTDGAFFASLDKRHGDLLVKLPAADVAARVGRGEGRAFAPAGRIFREWLALEPGSEAAWRTAVADALEFAGTK
jgi:hypothetical protein